MKRVVVAAAALVSVATAVAALEPATDEKEQLKACEARLCQVANKKDAAGEDVKCQLSKTWTRRTIEAGISQQKITWGFGDARCAINVDLKRAEIAGALSKPTHTITVPAHAVKCEVEREKELMTITLKVAPKLQFRSGKLEKAWLNVSDIEAPSVIKGAIWTAAKIEDNVGLFHGQIVKEVNKFLHEKCPARHGG
ncbi:MAG: hypothetical protein R3D27_00750 [Hyphomicrobiaceae bacterium]